MTTTYWRTSDEEILQTVQANRAGVASWLVKCKEFADHIGAETWSYTALGGHFQLTGLGFSERPKGWSDAPHDRSFCVPPKGSLLLREMEANVFHGAPVSGIPSAVAYSLPGRKEAVWQTPSPFIQGGEAWVEVRCSADSVDDSRWTETSGSEWTRARELWAGKGEVNE